MAQHTPKQWITGSNVPNNTIVDFSGGSLTMQSVLSGTQVPFSITNAAIGGPDSNLLFYSDGRAIYNRLHNKIQNGDTLSPGVYTFAAIAGGYGLQINQGTVFLPAPDDTNLFYVFHKSGDYWGQPCPNLSSGYVAYSFYYSIIDKSMDSGNGAIISKNNLILNDTIGSAILAIKHGNGRDWWIIVPDVNQPVFYRFLLTPAGVTGPYTETIGIGSCGGYWSIKFSALTNKIAGFKVDQIWPITKYIDIFDFDRCTGLMSNHQLLTINNYVNSQYPGACEISPSGRFLYAGVLDELHQFDLLASNIQASEIVVDTIDSINFWVNKFNYWFLQCAPDGKIYSSDWNNLTLSVINNPDSLGIACNPQQGAITLPNTHNLDLPYIPLYELGPLVGSACDTLTAIKDLNFGTDKSITVYPNPASDAINIYLPTVKSSNGFSISIFDLLGNEVYSFINGNSKSNSVTLSTNGLSNGMYFLKVISSDYSINCTVKIQIVK
ncbi:MAG: T9SS type A sorting domain-containing protein [Bacteroidia bacterium]